MSVGGVVIFSSTPREAQRAPAAWTPSSRNGIELNLAFPGNEAFEIRASALANVSILLVPRPRPGWGAAQSAVCLLAAVGRGGGCRSWAEGGPRQARTPAPRLCSTQSI